MRDWARAKTKEAHATTLAFRLLLVKTLIKEILNPLDIYCAAPPRLMVLEVPLALVKLLAPLASPDSAVSWITRPS